MSLNVNYVSEYTDPHFYHDLAGNALRACTHGYSIYLLLAHCHIATFDNANEILPLAVGYQCLLLAAVNCLLLTSTATCSCLLPLFVWLLYHLPTATC